MGGFFVFIFHFYAKQNLFSKTRSVLLAKDYAGILAVLILN
jgi:hypothetical protein